MLLNLSNHPSSSWPDNQVHLAKQVYGEIKDIPFPAIDPETGEDEILELAAEYLNRILDLKPKAVHLMGELNFTVALVNLLKSHGITVLASTTHRTTQTLADGNKLSKFEFVRFRSY